MEKKLCKTYIFKLITNSQTEALFDERFENYLAVSKFVAEKVCNNILNSLKELPEEEWIEGQCPKCYNPKNPKIKKLKYTWINEYGEIERNCGCLTGHFSFRKIFLPSKNYRVHPDWDMRHAGRLYYDTSIILKKGKDYGEKYNRTVYDTCLKKTTEAIRSMIVLNNKLKFMIEYYKGYGDAITEYLTTGKTTNKNVMEQIKDMLIDQTKESVISELKKRVKNTDITIGKLEHQLSGPLSFDKHTMRLSPSTCYIGKKDDKDVFVFRGFSKSDIYIDFYGKTRNEEYIIDTISKQNTDPEVEMLKRDGVYWVQYIYRVEKDIPEPNTCKTEVYVDFAIKNMACAVAVNTATNKVVGVKFWKCLDFRRKRRQMFKIHSILRSRYKKKNRSKKWFLNKINTYSQIRYTDKYVHNVTKHIVDYALTFEKPVIVMPAIKNIKALIRKVKVRRNTKDKVWMKQARFYNWECSSFVYNKMRSYVQYKAEWHGIPSVLVGNKDYVYFCSKCGHSNTIQKPFHELNFECEQCKHKVNSAINRCLNLNNIYTVQKKDDLSKSGNKD